MVCGRAGQKLCGAENALACGFLAAAARRARLEQGLELATARVLATRLATAALLEELKAYC